jgi:hypothetical protein
MNHQSEKKDFAFKNIKNMKRLIYINLIFAVLLFSTGCGKGFLTDLATNPNQPSQAPAALILPPILSGYASNVYFSSGTMGLWMGYYNISGNYSTTTNTNTYFVNSSGPSNWDNLYSILKNAAYIETNSASDPFGAYSVASAKILKCWGFQILVDGYGDVPYSEAFQGSANFFPKYDDGQSIYDSCILQLDNAINMINTADVNSTNLGNNDIMFRGDMSLWAKFANTLKLRFIIRQSNKISASDATAEIGKTASTGYLDQDAMVNPGYINTAGKQSPFWASYGVSPGGSLVSDGYLYLRGGGASVDFFKNNQDPRLFYTFAKDGSLPNTPEFSQIDEDASHYHAAYYGDRDAASAGGTNHVVGLGYGVMSGFDAPVPLFTAAESYFLQAEAAKRGWTGDNAEALYDNGITASFTLLYTLAGKSAAQAVTDASTYYGKAVDLIGWSASPNKIKAIITQKWAALSGINSFEAWTEYRRTGYPDLATLPLSKFTPLTTHIPTKLMYPNSEQSNNQENYNAAVAKGNDPQSTKVFWMP